MQYTIVGLGNPGDDYAGSRHNAGRSAVAAFAKKEGFSDWVYDKKLNAQVAKGKLGPHAVTLVLPDTFMNKSGSAVKPLMTSAKKLEGLVVVYDELDLPLGKLKISFGRSGGGHRGVESIIRAVKTKDFTRMRIGVSPTTPSGKLKKPKGEEQVVDFLMKPFKPAEEKEFKKVCTEVAAALATIIAEGRMKAMNMHN